MRDPKRIDDFCNQLAKIWKTKCPDWRFGQLISNVLGKMQSKGRDIFFPEEKEMLDFIKTYFEYEDIVEDAKDTSAEDDKTKTIQEPSNNYVTISKEAFNELEEYKAMYEDLCK